MKNALLIASIFTALVLLTMCEKDLNPTPNQLKLEALVPGGCNSYKELSTKSVSSQNDTVYTRIKGDSLEIYIGINYICCAPFMLEQSDKGDTLIVNIVDQCKIDVDHCYCKCMCYYDWQLCYSGVNTNLEYRVYLYDPRIDEKALFAEGAVEKY